ncbi:MAG: VWA domain-containing protein [Chlorobi bacterium]|nr:VWA domain-containing protein [Chlorobiota bacterium]
MQDWLSHIPRPGMEEPFWLLLFPVLVLAILLLHLRRKKGRLAALMFPDIDRLRSDGFEAQPVQRNLTDWLRWSALALCVLAMTRPYFVEEATVARSRGIDIVLALDISESMLQRDADGRSRLDALRDVAREFVEGHENDRIGVVVFKAQGYTLCPLTLDHRVASALIESVTSEVIRDEGTAVGTAILVALNRLKASESAQKIVILFSDGASNAGEIDPLTAASLAARQGIRIYTVGAGSGSDGPSDLHEEELRRVAESTGGRYFRSGGKASLAGTFRSIDHLEKSPLSSPVTRRKSALFLQFLVPAVVLLLLEIMVSNTRLLRIP